MVADGEKKKQSKNVLFQRMDRSQSQGPDKHITPIQKWDRRSGCAANCLEARGTEDAFFVSRVVDAAGPQSNTRVRAMTSHKQATPTGYAATNSHTCHERCLLTTGLFAAFNLSEISHRHLSFVRFHSMSLTEVSSCVQ